MSLFRNCSSRLLAGVVVTVPAVQPLPGSTSATVDPSMTPTGATVGHDLHLRINPLERSVRITVSVGMSGCWTTLI